MTELEIINCEQGTEEWHKARAGVITASEIHFVMASGRGGAPSETRRKYMSRMASERITGEPAQTGWNGNVHTERGKENEATARSLYEERMGHKVDLIGFAKRGTIGCSPDGLVSDHGGVEIKCKIPELHIEVLEKDEVPSDHIKQIQFSMLVMNRPWWDFVCYSPGLPLFVKRVEADVSLQSQMRVAVKQFELETDMLVKRIMEKF